MLFLCPHTSHYSVLSYNKKEINDRESLDRSAEEANSGVIKDIQYQCHRQPVDISVPTEADQITQFMNPVVSLSYLSD